MATTMTKKQREEVENLVYSVFAALDKSGTNEKYYRELFAGMSDAQFLSLMKKELPFRFQQKPSITNPSINDINDALDILGIPLLEPITEPFLYKNKDGVPVSTKEAFVGYIPHKKVQQFISKKNKFAVDIANRDIGGRLLSGDKGATMSDREFETLATTGLTNTMKEFAGPKADSMEAKNAMYNILSTKGVVHLDEIPDNIDDSLSRNMFNVYLIGAHLNSNLINQGDYTIYTLKDKKRLNIERS